ncbi:MAG: hypothetical protein AAF531_08045 [Actinomycetota bacterium]
MTVRTRGALLGSLLIAVLLVGCSEEDPTGFTVDNETGFLAACTAPLEDDRLVSDICQCVIQRTEAEIEFSRFSAIDADLLEAPDGELPQEITDIVAECVIEEGDL